jgi:putative aldouronate transport system permease protein
MKSIKKLTLGTVFIHTFFILFSACFIIPFIYVISVSLTNEADILNEGYRLIPKNISFVAYQYVFANPKQIIDAYKVTIFTSFVGTIMSVAVMAMIAYPLSRNTFKGKNIVTFFIFFTMLFGGGLIPTYILNTQYLKLGNNIWIYILPTLVNAWSIIIIRTFFQGLPPSLIESAKIDGAREIRIFSQIILPLSKPVLATISLMALIGKWNDWYTSLIYIRDTELYTLQYLLQRILREVDFINTMARDMPNIPTDSNLPTESMRFAMCIISAGPMLLAFPFFQKYFAKGLTVGAVKG